MAGLIGYSTGMLYSWTDSVNRQINILRKTPAKAVEILFGDLSRLRQTISPLNVAYLRSLDFVSIHAPFYSKGEKKMQYGKDKATEHVLKLLKAHYIRLKCRAVVVHPNNITDKTWIKSCGMKISIENMPKGRRIGMAKLKSFIFTNKTGMVLDTAHALTYSKTKIRELIGEFKDSISHVHLSDRRYSISRRKVCDHQQLMSCPDIEKLEAVKELSCPIIIELNLRDRKNDIMNLIEEYKFVNGWHRQA